MWERTVLPVSSSRAPDGVVVTGTITKTVFRPSFTHIGFFLESHVVKKNKFINQNQFKQHLKVQSNGIIELELMCLTFIIHVVQSLYGDQECLVQLV
jgi:hypothetical protein